MQKKSCQYQHYGMGGIGKDETGEYGHLVILEKVASVVT